MFSTKLVRNLGLAVAMTFGLAVFAAPASAQLQPWEDYEASESVWIVTHVDLDPGTFGIYLEGLKSTWVAANEVAKELGQIKDYGIYSNQFGGADEFDLLLVVEMEAPTTSLRTVNVTRNSWKRTVRQTLIRPTRRFLNSTTRFDESRATTCFARLN